MKANTSPTRRIAWCWCLLLPLLGCESYQVPPSLTKSQRAEWARKDVSDLAALVVGVVEPQVILSPGTYTNAIGFAESIRFRKQEATEAVMRLLRESELFKAVNIVERLESPPNLLVRPVVDETKPVYGESGFEDILPCGLTLGLYPISFTYYLHTCDMVFVAPSDGEVVNTAPVPMHYEVECRKLMGLLAGFNNVRADWVWSPDYDDIRARSAEHFRIQLVEKQAEIMALTSR